MRSDRTLARLTLLVCTLASATAPALGAQEPGPGVGLRLGVGGGGGLCAPALLPGVEVRTGGRLYGVAVLDTYLSRSKDRDPCGARRSPEGREEVTRIPLTAPRMRAGVGVAGSPGGVDADARFYVGQQGVLEGPQPLAGVGVGLGRGGWAVELGGHLHRARVHEVVPIPDTELNDERLLRREWAPSFEAAARFRAGALGGGPGTDGATGLWRPVLGGVAGGTAGAAVGFVGGLVAARGCEGDEVCLMPALVGAVVGETLGVPLGVHLAEGRRGSLALGALASTAVTAAGLGAIAFFGDSGPPAQGVAVLVPVAQLWAAIAVERRTAR